MAGLWFRTLARPSHVSVFTVLIPLAIPAQEKAPNAQLAARPLNARVESLLKKMTLEEKIGQLVQFSAGFATGPERRGHQYAV